jgi:dihydroorotate dehydrogenase (fumarate)/dihydroorotate dehydrogenase
MLPGPAEMSLYRRLIRPLLFCLDAERAHHLAVEACRWAGAVAPLQSVTRLLLTVDDPMLRCEVAGLPFANPVGLAAGWDKSARAIAMLSHLGFGFVEIGSVSIDPSVGNSRPRLFRLPAEQAIVVNYGLPNDGAAAVAARLQRTRRRDVPLGINLVKTNRGPQERASDDVIIDEYARAAAVLHTCGDYLTLNLSCPNAEGGKDLFAEPRNLERLLGGLRPLGLKCPVFLKVAPCTDPASIDGMLAAVEGYEFVRGFQFNLPVGKHERLQLATPREALTQMPGSVSGRPVAGLIDDCVRAWYLRIDRQRQAIIAAGGVFTAEDAYTKIRLGASLVQVYTALIYEGPGVVKQINQGLCRLLARDGFRHVSEAVGVDA